MSEEQYLSLKENDLDMNFGKYKKLIKRNKIFFSLLSSSIFFSFISFGIISKPKWEGYFQILVKELPNSQNPTGLNSIGNNNPLKVGQILNSARNTVKTEIKILKSSSVLKPVYEYAKSYKEKKGKDTSDWAFKDWVNNKLLVERDMRTSVINITFRDKDKEFILDILNKTSKEFQDYSKRDKLERLDRSEKYLNMQVKKLKRTADNSMRKAQQFALENGVGIIDGLPKEQLIGVANKKGAGISVEAKRELVQGNIDNLKQKIIAAKESKERSIYFASQISDIKDSFSEYQNTRLAILRDSSLFTQNDDRLVFLRKRKEDLENFLNKETILLLESRLEASKAELKALTKPRDIVLDHRELVRNAIRDEKSLSEFDTLLQAVKFDQFRITPPWKLISPPQIYEQPVSLSWKVYGLLGLILGPFSALAFIYLYEKNSKFFYQIEDLEKVFNLKVTLKKKLGSTLFEDSLLILFKNLFSYNTNTNTKIIKLGDISDKNYEKLLSKLKELDNTNFEVISSLKKVYGKINLILITQFEKIEKDKISEYAEIFKISEFESINWIHFED